MITQLDLDKLVLTAIAKAYKIEKDFMRNYSGESDFFPYQEVPNAQREIRIENTPERPFQEDSYTAAT